MPLDGFTTTDLTRYFEYLDDLRERGETNMYGARPYLVNEFALELEEARTVLSLSMKSDLNIPASERARQALETPDV